jgi:hypothetical protein
MRGFISSIRSSNGLLSKSASLVTAGVVVLVDATVVSDVEVGAVTVALAVFGLL